MQKIGFQFFFRSQCLGEDVLPENRHASLSHRPPQTQRPPVRSPVPGACALQIRHFPSSRASLRVVKLVGARRRGGTPSEHSCPSGAHTSQPRGSGQTLPSSGLRGPRCRTSSAFGQGKFAPGTPEDAPCSFHFPSLSTQFPKTETSNNFQPDRGKRCLGGHHSPFAPNIIVLGGKPQ